MYSVLPEGDGHNAKYIKHTLHITRGVLQTIPQGMDMVDVNQKDWSEILENVIKPFGWGTWIIVVADHSATSKTHKSPAYNTKIFASGRREIITGTKWAFQKCAEQHISWKSSRTFKVDGIARVLVRSRCKQPRNSKHPRYI